MVGSNLSGVGVYSNEITRAVAESHPEHRFLYCYRPHRFVRGLGRPLPRNGRARLLWRHPPARARLFHALNQRVDQRGRAPVITTFHDLFVFSGDYSTPGFKQRFTVQARQAAALSDLIIAVSEFTARQVHEILDVERSRIRVVHHGVWSAPLAPPIKRERMVLFVGAIQKRKNVARLVQAFEAMPRDWKLVLAGAFGFGAEEALRAIERSPRARDIEMRGYVSDAELERLYARASIFAFPSLDEGFGIPVLEAMARGVPVLTSNGSALREVAGDAALLVNCHETEAVAEGLRQLANDEALSADLREKGLKHSARFTWKRASDDTWQAYQELLSV